MASVNKVILIGNLGADPELRKVDSGDSVCELRVATNEKWIDKSGEKQERVEWHRVVVWGKSGEACAKFLSKGSPVYVEGKNRTRSWDDKDGNKRYMTEVVANDVQFLPSGDGKKGASEPAAEKSGRSAPPNTYKSNDDIPF